MNESFYSIITNTGAQIINDALSKGEKLDLSFIGVGDGNGKYYEPSANQTELVNEKYRASISEVTNLTAKGLIPANVGGFYIREVGLFDKYNNLILIAKQPETYKPLASEGSTKEMWLKVMIQAISSNVLQFKVDTSLQYATVQWVLSIFNDYKNSTTMRTAQYDTNANGLVDTCEIIDGGGFNSDDLSNIKIDETVMSAIIYDQNLNGIIDTCEYIDGSTFKDFDKEETSANAYFMSTKDYDSNQDGSVDNAESIDAGEF